MSGSQRTVLIQKGEKNEHWGEKLLATTEWGLIGFDPQGKDDMVGGDTLSYDEYLDLQMQSGKK